MDNYDSQREIKLLENAISKIQNFGGHFVAYNTKYLGSSLSDDYKIKGKSTVSSKRLNEFCYAYDGEHGQLHLVDIYQMTNGVKYGAIEMVNNVYAYWEIVD